QYIRKCINLNIARKRRRRMLEQLKEDAYEANMPLPQHNSITCTRGAVRGLHRERGHLATKRSGVEYEAVARDKRRIVDVHGNRVEGKLKPSSDTPTHIELYKAFSDIKGIVHTHSPWAVSFAQAGADMPAAGTTQGDYFYGAIPATREMRREEIISDYEKQTGTVIVETFKERNIDPNRVPGVLVNDHAPFTWGDSPENAVHNSVVLEQVAEMTYH